MDDLSHSDDTASNFREVGPDILSAQTEELRERPDLILISKNKTDISHIKLRASKEPTILDDVKATLTPEQCQSAVDFHTGLCCTFSNITSSTVLITNFWSQYLLGRGKARRTRQPCVCGGDGGGSKSHLQYCLWASTHCRSTRK